MGRDVLIGCCGGLLLAFIELAKLSVPAWLGLPAPRPTFGVAVLMLGGLGPVLFSWIVWALGAVEGALLTVLIIVVLRLALRKIWVALVVTALLVSVTFMQYMSGTGQIGLVFPLINGALFTFIAYRFGLLPLVITRFIYSVVLRMPVMLDASHWAAAPALWTLAVLLALSLFAFVASRGGQPIFGTWLEDRAPARA